MSDSKKSVVKSCKLFEDLVVIYAVSAQLVSAITVARRRVFWTKVTLGDLTLKAVLTDIFWAGNFRAVYQNDARCNPKFGGAKASRPSV